LQAARTIVKNALAEASKLNKALVASPLRNNYGLNPGAEVGAGRVPGAAGSAAINQDVPPLLVISDQIAAVAKLVTEADAVRNVSRGHVPTRSDSLARKGTVPWGNDPKYVSLNT
jgi:hypothetical protein